MPQPAATGYWRNLPLHFESAAHQFVNEFSARKPMEAIHVFIM